MRNFLFSSVSARAGAKAALLAASLALTACGGDSAPVVTQAQLDELRVRADAFAGRDAATLTADAAAMSLGHELFAVQCASCHGGDGIDLKRDVTDLTAGVFDYGDSVDAIRTTITQGRLSVMPNHGGAMGERDLGSLVALVQSMVSGEEMDLFKDSAEKLYTDRCIECHGREGKGDTLRGIPDLTDNYFQHGDSMMNIRLVITRGVESQCPAQSGILSAAEIEVLTGYVLKLRGA
ncbi:MAG: c-type cytochrome [Pseudomonadales bacterium]|jgi:cytochrome c oxidase cbb3-type subunit 3|nr:c-type cytochrome [Pseudomonadales bacterium]